MIIGVEVDRDCLWLVYVDIDKNSKVVIVMVYFKDLQNYKIFNL